jgi:hypothetical protein
MTVKIKVNPREPESLKRFYVIKNNVLVKCHLTYDEAVKLKERILKKGD